MTPTQLKILTFFGAYYAQARIYPSMVEIAEGLGYSPKSKASISRIIQQLIHKGYMFRKTKRAGYERTGPRPFRITERGWATLHARAKYQIKCPVCNQTMPKEVTHDS